MTPKELAEQIRASVFEVSYHAESRQWIIGLLSTEMEKQVAAALAEVDAQARREEREAHKVIVDALESLSSDELDCGLFHEEACCIKEAHVHYTADEALDKFRARGQKGGAN